MSDDVELKFPVFSERLPPPPAGTLDEYYEFVTMLAEMRPKDDRPFDEDLPTGPRFTLFPDGTEPPPNDTAHKILELMDSLAKIKSS